MFYCFFCFLCLKERCYDAKMLPRCPEGHPGGHPNIRCGQNIWRVITFSQFRVFPNVTQPFTSSWKRRWKDDMREPNRLSCGQTACREMKRRFPGCLSPAPSPRSLSRVSVSLVLRCLAGAVTSGVNSSRLVSPFASPFLLLPVTVALSLSSLVWCLFLKIQGWLMSDHQLNRPLYPVNSGSPSTTSWFLMFSEVDFFSF